MIKPAICMWFYNLLYALDVLVNVILGGDRRDTISSRIGKGQLAGKPVHSAAARIVDVFFLAVFREQAHCRNAIMNIDDYYSISSVIDRHRK